MMAMVVCSTIRVIASTFGANPSPIPRTSRGPRDVAAPRRPAERGGRPPRIRAVPPLLDLAVDDQRGETLIGQQVGPGARGRDGVPDEGFLVQRVAPLSHRL